MLPVKGKGEQELLQRVVDGSHVLINTIIWAEYFQFREDGQPLMKINNM